MAPNEADALVADLCRNLALLRRCAGGIHQTEANLLARYRAVVDALGCREAFEEALLQQVLQPWSADERGARIADAG